MSETPQPSGQDSSANLASGLKVGGGRYTLVRQLGKGGMGIVWLAQDERLKEPAALKFLSADFSTDPTALDSLRDETQRSRRLTHPNIIRIHDLFEPPGERPFIAMEYVEGKTLSQLKAEQPQRAFTWEFLRPLVLQLCAALDYAHAEKIIHRDLKPANLMLDAKGRLKLADFGIAVAVADSMSRLTGARSISGTPAYMSPQQLDGETASVTDDIYALGATLYELLSSKPPFYSGDIAHQTRMNDPVPLEQRLAEFGITAAVPTEVSACIMACLAKEPKLRPAGALELAQRIGFDTSAIIFRTGQTPVNTGTPASRRRRLVAVTAIALLGLAAVVWFTSDRDPAGASSVAASSGESAAKQLGEGWLLLFEKPLRRWTEEPERWTVGTDGTIIGMGGKAGVLKTSENFTNFLFYTEAKLAPGALGNVFLRARKQKKGLPLGYFVVLGNTHRDYRRTGSVIRSQGVLVSFQDILESPVKDDEWFRVQTAVVGRRVIVRINDKIVVDRVDTESMSTTGGIALWHPGGSVIMFRRPQVRELPLDETQALAEARKFIPGLK